MLRQFCFYQPSLKQLPMEKSGERGAMARSSRSKHGTECTCPYPYRRSIANKSCGPLRGHNRRAPLARGTRLQFLREHLVPSPPHLRMKQGTLCLHLLPTCTNHLVGGDHDAHLRVLVTHHATTRSRCDIVRFSARPARSRSAQLARNSANIKHAPIADKLYTAAPHVA